MLSLAEKGVGVDEPSGRSMVGTPLGAPCVADGMVGGVFSRTGKPILC